MPKFKLSPSEMSIIESNYKIDRPVISKTLIEMHDNRSDLDENDRGFIDRLVKRHSIFQQTIQSSKYLKNMDYYHCILNDYIMYSYILASCTTTNFEISPNVDITPYLLLTKYYGSVPLELIDRIIDNCQAVLSSRYDTSNGKNERYSLINPLLVGAYMNTTNTPYILDNLEKSQLFFVNKLLSSDFKYALVSNYDGGFSLTNLGKLLNALNTNNECVIDQYDLYNYVVDCMQSGFIKKEFIPYIERLTTHKNNLDTQYFVSILKLFK